MSDKERNQQVAMTILQQLGGQGKLAAMTGANGFVIRNEERGGIHFRIKNRKGPNYVKIILNGRDLYDIEFGRIWGTKYTVKAEHLDIFATMLKEIFEKETGMYLSL